MSRVPRPTRHVRSGPLILAGVALVTFIALALIVKTAGNQPTAPARQPAPHFVDVPPDAQTSAAERTVVVAQPGQAFSSISGTDGFLKVNLVTGQIPVGATQAIVRTDSDCAPDQHGVSHCLNELDFGSSTVAVRHHHKMSITPCLTPGEKVNVISAAQYQE